MTLPVRYNAFAAVRYSARHDDPPGANDWAGANVWEGQPDRNPVVLVHGSGGRAASNWFSLSPLLVNAGFRVFAPTYGNYGHGKLTRRAGGVGDAYLCGDELAAYVDRVIAATGQPKVDLVGHSFGGLLIQYYLKRLGGDVKVDRVVGLAPTFHGTTFNGLLRLPFGARVGAWLMGENIPQQAATSDFVRDLYTDGDCVPGVTYTVISPLWDTFTTPIRRQRLEGPNVTNLRMRGPAEHITLVFSRKPLQQVVAALAR